MLNSVLVVSLFAHLVQAKLLLFTFYLNGGLRAVYIGKPSNQLSWTVRFLKTESEPHIGFPHISKASSGNLR